MPTRRHPFLQAPAGSVFAVAIAAGRWGWGRFFADTAMGVLSLVGDAPTLPAIDWSQPPLGWILSFRSWPGTAPCEKIGIGPPGRLRAGVVKAVCDGPHAMGGVNYVQELDK